ncbi:amino acid adenylation domain-containing protein, partial [Clostridium frigidicarnis]
NNNEIELDSIDLLLEEERNQILYEFNDTKADYPKDKTIQELFEAQVEKTPDNIAVIFEDKKLTYRELNEKANSLAKILRNKGVKADSIVGIMVERSLEMIIGIMGILKAGGAYLPIDPIYPKERIEFMLKDSESKVLLSENVLVNNIEFNGEILDLYNEDLFNKNSSNLEKINGSNNLAYVIYTSGTTGNPKGVLIEQKNVVNLLKYYIKNYNINEQTTIFQTTNYCFDPSVEQIFGALIGGSKVCCITKNVLLDKVVFRNNIKKNKVNIINLTPGLLENLICDNEMLNEIEFIICGGEKLNNKLKNKIISKGYDLRNHYGPTEYTVDAIICKCKNNEMNIIGHPINNTEIYILNEGNDIVPIGVIGELCISGDGLARGYLNRPELTAEKFVDNPFKIGTKMYKTGDLARWLPDGNIELLGRIDNQVKIRGFRIEIGEIENKLLQHENIKEATVIAIDGKDDDKQICSYIVSDKELNELNLRDYLKESLPEYMIPSYFVKLDKMPITSNGKLDRRALPKPNLDERLTSYEAPRNELEETLSRIWSEVLGIDKVGINDSFFELGGHSLKAMTLISKIHKE